MVFRYRASFCYLAMTCCISMTGSLLFGGEIIVETDVTYGKADDCELKLDVVRPAKLDDKALPAIIYIHGGGWRAGDKSWGYPSLYPFAESGKYATFTINYRLSVDAKWPAQIHDCKAAIRWVRANAGKYNVDPNRIGVWGGSAGGHLVNLVATSSHVRQLEGDAGSPNQPSNVACAVSFCGPSDFGALAEIKAGLDGSPVELLLGGPIRQNMGQAREASPIKHITSDCPPILLFHGTKDDIVSIEQTERFHKALQKAKVDSTFVKVIEGGHNFACPQVLQRVTAFFDKHLRGESVEVLDTPIKEPRLMAGEILARMVGKWQLDRSIVTWSWALNRQCLSGSRKNAVGAEVGFMVMSYEPATSGIVFHEFYPAFGNRTIHFTSFTANEWKGKSVLTLNDGTVETATIVVIWSGPDDFEMEYTDRRLNGKLPIGDQSHSFMRI